MENVRLARNENWTISANSDSSPHITHNELDNPSTSILLPTSPWYPDTTTKAFYTSPITPAPTPPPSTQSPIGMTTFTRKQIQPTISSTSRISENVHDSTTRQTQSDCWRTSTMSSISIVSSYSTPTAKPHRHDRTSLRLGIGIGVVIGLAILTICLICCLLKKRKKWRTRSTTLSSSFVDKLGSAEPALHRSQEKYYPGSLYMYSMQDTPFYGYTKFNDAEYAESSRPTSHSTR